MEPIPIYRGYKKQIFVALGYDVSEDDLSSQIRVTEDPESDLLATWAIGFVTDGTDGELILTLDASETNVTTHSKGYMNIKRISAGEPYVVFDGVLECVFEDVPTV